MSGLLGSEVPRVFTPPLRELTPETSYGFSVIDFAEGVLGIELFPWQRWFFVHALEAAEDGSFRFRTILLLAARQNGKTTVARVIALWSLFVLQVSLVLGTAQNLDTSEDTWEGAVEMVEGNPDLAPELRRVVRVNGKKAMVLSFGGAYKVAAASRRAGRGKTSDVAILDELREHLSWEPWAAVTKTTNARPDALVLCMSNAGDAYSVVLRHLRFLAHKALGDPDGWCAGTGDLGGSGGDGSAEEAAAADSGEEDAPEGGEAVPADALAIFEWSAPPGCSVWDRQGWRQANPSLGYTITEKVIASDAATDSEAVFRTECLCQWVETVRAEPFPEGAWDAGTEEESAIAPESALAFGLDVSGDRTHAAIAVAGWRADGRAHVELVAYRAGTAWPLTWLSEHAPKYPGMRVAWQKRGAPVSSMADELCAVGGIEPFEAEGRDLAAWCGRLWDGVSACLKDSDSDAAPVMHRPQPALDKAAKTAATRPLGDAAWAFDRSKSPEDCSPLVACAMAYGLLTRREAPKEIPSAYTEERGIVSF